MEDVQEKATADGMEALREWLALRRQLPFYDALIQVRSLSHCLLLILFLQLGVTAIEDLRHLEETDFEQLGSGLKLRCLRYEISKLRTPSPRVSPSCLPSAVPVSCRSVAA
jgi:hypothetical protein